MDWTPVSAIFYPALKLVPGTSKLRNLHLKEETICLKGDHTKLHCAYKQKAGHSRQNIRYAEFTGNKRRGNKTKQNKTKKYTKELQQNRRRQTCGNCQKARNSEECSSALSPSRLHSSSYSCPTCLILPKSDISCTWSNRLDPPCSLHVLESPLNKKVSAPANVRMLHIR